MIKGVTVQWPFVLLAAILLWPPLPLSVSLKKSVMSSRRNASATVPLMMKCWQNWADLLRAGAGAYVLSTLAIQVDAKIKGASTTALMLEGVVLGIGLILQMFRIGRGIQFVAPIFYTCGLTLVLPGYVQGGFAVFVGFLFAIGGNRPAYLLPVMGVALAAVGLSLDSTLTLPLLLDCSLIGLPVLLAFLFQKPLAFVAKEWTLAPEASE